MPSLHIANTFFEWELSCSRPVHLKSAFEKHEVFLQLQFVPFLYASSDDAVLVTDLPSEKDWQELKKLRRDLPRCQLLTSKEIASYDKIEAWGASRAIASWASEHGLPCRYPPWETVSAVNSKAFSFTHSPKLENGALLYTKEEAVTWIKSQRGPFVLKTCFGLSGRGHHISDPSQLEKAIPFLDKELASHPLIAEPWVERVLDFSTQWEILETKEIHFLGSTLCESDSLGRHKGNQAGNEESLFQERLPFLFDHKKKALVLLERMAALGYFGNVGIDAMVYIKNGQEQLHPIVEINARKTMGWLALQMQKLYFPQKTISLRYLAKKEGGLLPGHLLRKGGSSMQFKKQLYLTSY